jgi:hypothetical protein
LKFSLSPIPISGRLPLHFAGKDGRSMHARQSVSGSIGARGCLASPFAAELATILVRLPNRRRPAEWSGAACGTSVRPVACGS